MASAHIPSTDAAVLNKEAILSFFAACFDWLPIRIRWRHPRIRPRQIQGRQDRYPMVHRLPPREKPLQYLATAIELWETGQEAVAGAVCRIAIETHVRYLWDTDPRIAAKSSDWPPMGYTLRQLARAGILDRRSSNRIHHLYRYGNYAAHGEPVRYDRIAELLWAAKVFIESVQPSNN